MKRLLDPGSFLRAAAGRSFLLLGLSILLQMGAVCPNENVPDGFCDDAPEYFSDSPPLFTPAFIDVSGACGPVFPGALCSFYELSKYFRDWCASDSISAYGRCLDVPGSEFCEDLVLGEYCSGGSVLAADDVLEIRSCMEVWADHNAVSFDACWVKGEVVSGGYCEEYEDAYLRLRECLQVRGPQSLRDGECFLWFARYDGELLADCPWWESYECLEMYIDAT
jgi:hypothetical protein